MKRSIYMPFLPLLLAGQHAAGQTPTPCPSPTPTTECAISCPLPTPTFTPVPSPTPIAAPPSFIGRVFPDKTLISGTGQFRNVQTRGLLANSARIPSLEAGNVTAVNLATEGLVARYGAIGSKWYLRPRSESLGLDWSFAPPPFHYSATNYNPPPKFYNSWAPLAVQAVFRDDMWADDSERASFFAPNTIYMVGAVVNAISNIETGVGKSRPPAPLPPYTFPLKYTIGAWNQAQLVGGGTNQDLFSAIGTVSFGYTSYSSANDTEPGTGLQRLYANYVAGIETGSIASRWIGPNLGPGQTGPMDGREAMLKEDDTWDAAPAFINMMVGTTTQVWVDNKRAGFCSDGASDPPQPSQVLGQINYAVGTRSAVIGGVENSWVNVTDARGVTAALYLNESIPSSPGYYCGDERMGSRIGTWIGIESSAPAIDPCKTNLGAAIGAFIYDQSPHSGGGAPPQVANEAIHPAMKSEGQARSPEASASIIARGEVVFGDGVADGMQNYDTDVLHVRDVLRLAGRTAPPSFAPHTPPSERVGLLYFDVTRNALRVSVAMDHDTKADWQEAPIAWVDVAVAGDGIEPSRDVQGAKSAPTLGRAEVASSMKAAGERAARGESPFLEPRAVVVAPSAPAKSTLGRDEATPLTFLLSGFHGLQPRIFWKRIGSGQQGEGEIGWRELDSTLLKSDDPSAGVFSAMELLAAEGTAGRAGAPGDVVQFLFIHPRTGQTTGASIRL